MVNFNDVSRNIEARTLARAFAQGPTEAALSAALSRSGTPQNLTASNRNPDERAPGQKRLLRCDTVPIGEGVLAR